MWFIALIGQFIFAEQRGNLRGHPCNKIYIYIDFIFLNAFVNGVIWYRFVDFVLWNSISIDSAIHNKLHIFKNIINNASQPRWAIKFYLLAVHIIQKNISIMVQIYMYIIYNLLGKWKIEFAVWTASFLT